MSNFYGAINLIIIVSDDHNNNKQFSTYFPKLNCALSYPWGVILSTLFTCDVQTTKLHMIVPTTNKVVGVDDVIPIIASCHFQIKCLTKKR